MIDPKDHGFVDIFAGRGDQNALRSSGQMLFGTRAVSEESGAFKCDIDTVCSMRQVGRVALGGHMNAFAVHDNIVAIGLNGARECAVYAIALEQKSICLRWCKIVNRDQFKIMIVALQNSAGNQAANSTKSVNCYFNSHAELLELSAECGEDLGDNFISAKAKMFHKHLARCRCAKAVDADIQAIITCDVRPTKCCASLNGNAQRSIIR